MGKNFYELMLEAADWFDYARGRGVDTTGYMDRPSGYSPMPPAHSDPAIPDTAAPDVAELKMIHDRILDSAGDQNDDVSNFRLFIDKFLDGFPPFEGERIRNFYGRRSNPDIMGTLSDYLVNMRHWASRISPRTMFYFGNSLEGLARVARMTTQTEVAQYLNQTLPLVRNLYSKLTTGIGRDFRDEQRTAERWRSRMSLDSIRNLGGRSQPTRPPGAKIGEKWWRPAE